MKTFKEYRKESGFTQSSLSMKTGVSLRVIKALEQGDRSLQMAAALTICKLADALGTTAEDLIGYENERTKN